MKKRLFFCFFLVTLGTLSAVAQTPTTQGTEFWASFMRNGYNTTMGSYNHFTLIASAKHACTVTVSNPNTGWSDQFSVQNNGVSTYYVNRNQGYNDQMGGKAFKGLYITSTDTISLYIANEAENSYDAANVLPASALGSQYMIQSYKALGDQSGHPGDSRASFLVLATEDNTVVNITPSCLTYDSHAAGQTYSVSLNRGECYHVLNMNAGNTLNADGDFSGTTVASVDNKPIAVFNGNSITSVPGGLSTGYDHVFEQAMPTDYWGKKFVVTSTRCPNYMNLQPDQIKVTALNDNTTVTRNGAVLFTLNEGESNFFAMDLVSDPCTYLEADNPIAVFLYQHSHGDGSPAYGDPSMVWISPVEQKVYEVTFSTFEVQEVEVHYVNVVCYSENVADMTLDGQNISDSFAQVPGFPELSYTRMQLNHAAHTLRCPGGFIAHVYGIGQAEGYAYSVGSSAKQLTKQLFVDDILSSEFPNGYDICQSQEVHFRVETNYDIHHVAWDFGNGASDTGEEVSYIFEEVGNYDVQSVVYRNIDNQVQPFDTLSVVIHVNPLIEMQLIDSTCYPVYHFHGKEFSVPYFGDAVFPSDEGCDTVYHLNIMEGTSSSFVTYDTACMEYEWFDTIRYESGTYIVVLNQPGGCDSLYILNLTIGNPPVNPVRSKSSCLPYYWDNRIVCDTSGTYRLSFETPEHCVYDSVLYFTHIPAEEHTIEKDTCDQYEWLGKVYTEMGFHTYDTIVEGGNGCQSHLTLNLTLHSSPPFEQIVGLTQVAVATSFWPGQYIYYLDDSIGMITSRIQWELLDNPVGAGQWELKPHGASCTITAYSMGERLLRVSTGNGLCDKEAFKSIYCSGYDVEENEIPDLEIYPNPVRDELMVNGPEMLELTIYNLLGQKMKTVTANGETAVRVDVEGLPQALYLLKVQTRRGNKTRLISVYK